MPNKGKNYRASAEKLAGKEMVSLSEGIKLLKETSTTKFDGSAEVHLNLNIDPKQADQVLRGTIALPHGTGKKVRIAAVVGDDKVKAAKDAGATAAGLEDLIEEFGKGKINYDIVVAETSAMKALAKVAKTLGQKGVMPSPKSGTVTDDIEKTIKELMQGRIEYRNDKEGNVHCMFGKVSFKEDQLEENFSTLFKAIREAKPSGIKGTYIKSVTLASTMGPGIRLDINELTK